MSRPALPPIGSPPRGRALDSELVEMLKVRAEANGDPGDGFVSAIHEHDRTLEIDGLMIYAWGPSAAVLAKNLGMDATPRTKRLAAPAPTPAPNLPKLGHKLDRPVKLIAPPESDK